MIEATSCGGVVIFRGKILLLYKNFKNKYEVLGIAQGNGRGRRGIQGIQRSERSFERKRCQGIDYKVYRKEGVYLQCAGGYGGQGGFYWYLMMADSYYSKPQREEYFVDSGFYKYHEATIC